MNETENFEEDLKKEIMRLHAEKTLNNSQAFVLVVTGGLITATAIIFGQKIIKVFKKKDKKQP
jgi:hypothetical protein